MHFVFGHAPAARRTNPRVAMGHYVRGTRRVLPVRECPVHDPRGNALAFAFGDAFAKAGVAAADASGRGVLQGLAIRVGCHTKETMATLVVTSDDDRRVRPEGSRDRRDAVADAGDRQLLGNDPKPVAVGFFERQVAAAYVGNLAIDDHDGAGRSIQLQRGNAWFRERVLDDFGMAKAVVLVGLRREMGRECASNFTRKACRDLLLVFFDADFSADISALLPPTDVLWKD